MTWNPPGYIPGYHIPGTLTPGGAIVAQEREQRDRQVLQQAQEQRRNITNLLLVLR